MFLYQTNRFHQAFPPTYRNRFIAPLTLVAGLATLGALSASLGGCSHLPPPAAPVAMAATAGSAGVTATEPQTVTSNLPDLPDAAGASMAGLSTDTVIPDAAAGLSATAPKNYTVQKGDTLWHLANLFLKDPWLWPEIWHANPEVSNPHRIYPGDGLRLARGADGKPMVQLVRRAGNAGDGGDTLGAGTRLEPLLRSSSLEAPIANIPYASIAAFLSRPGVLTWQQVKAAPYILSLRDRHMIAGAGNDVYVRRLTAADGERLSVMHVGQELRDPEGRGTLGYLADYAGAAVVSRAGDPARVLISESAREVLAGDVLVPETGGTNADFVPHAPTATVKARVLAVVNGVTLAGQYQVVAINRGSQDGLEPGHVLRANAANESAYDHCARVNGNGTCTPFAETRLPTETKGSLLVFRVYERVSYALVASEQTPISVGDHVVDP